ncbi:hypothetical protein QMZ92_09015 [Streptomyces sp. HNM0645]|uniref:hypothetical protein n=1 Tax=Streptomyces sp. HNM0645 TaxID=2782343 RepID=UPI0024B63942|nr:hypothetical protein [Streptomyces sp. HNM0645]MDI9884537.1 hypothetical protein [Streptomyces sp. HNM0645]
MTGPSRRWRRGGSLVAWWLLFALGLWLVGQAIGRPASLTACVASAALVGFVGETGDWLRRRLRACRATPGTRPAVRVKPTRR